jgi:signal peptidase I
MSSKKRFERYDSGYRLRKNLSWILKSIVFLFILYEILSSFLIFSISVNSSSMETALNKKDALFISRTAWGIKLPFTDKTLFPAEPQRGDIVVYEYEKKPLFLKLADDLTGFLTFGRLSVSKDLLKINRYGYMLKRTAAVPGDTVYMKDFILYIKENNSEEYRAENSYYRIKNVIPEIPAGWKSGFPMDGTMSEVSLKEGEYFLLNDNRHFTADSRTTGPVAMEKIIGKAVFRFFPFKAFSLF